MINVSRLAVRWGAVCVLLLVGWLQTACKTGASDSKIGGSSDTTGTQFASVRAVADTNSSSDVNGELDKLRVGDKVTIDFYDMPVPFPQREERIKEDGTITLLEGKTFVAAGKTRGQLEQEIHDFYVPRYYVKMTISVRQMKETQFYYVRGEVKVPGRQIYISRITVLRAIGSAGDFTDFARKTEIKLIRADGTTKTLNAKKLLKNPALDLEIFPGDTVYVPRRSILY